MPGETYHIQDSRVMCSKSGSCYYVSRQYWGVDKKSNQGNQDSSRNLMNVIHGQRPDKDNRHTK